MKFVLASVLFAGAVAGISGASEVGIASGSATMSFDLSTMLGQTPLNTYDAAFGITETRAEVLALPGNNPPSSITWDINPLGTPSPAGRSIQGTNLMIDPANVLGSWAGVTSDVGVFASGGEQIGFGGATRWTLDPGIQGVLVFGDWGLRYSAARAGTPAGSSGNIRSGLVLTSNFDFANATFADLGNLHIEVVGNTLSIHGDMLISDAMLALGFPQSNLGLDIGDFSLTATLVPAPGAAALLGLAGLGMGRRRRRDDARRSSRALMLAGVGAAAVAGAASAGVQPNTTANGTAYMTIDLDAWSTVAAYANYTDISGNDLGYGGPSANAAGQRWMFADRFEGTGWIGAAYPSDYLTGPTSPLTQPLGGFAMAVNTYGVNSFAANHKITDYNSSSNPTGWIGLGGSFRATSDFNEPGASVWWEHLAVRQDPTDSIWKIWATSGPGQGSLFELRNVVAETIDGHLHLSADYVFGSTDWLQFFQDYNGHLDTELVLGHIEIVPVPAPGAAALLGLAGLITGTRRRR